MDEELKEHIRRLREDFSRGSLDEKDADPDPSLLFRKWMQDAVEARIIELQAMNLSTVSPDGRPSARIVYLREFGDHAFTFYTNYNSRKAKDLTANPHAALTFYWPHLERQVRIEGTVAKSEGETSDNYFNNRPFESRLGAWASGQSEKLSSRIELEKKIEQLRKEFTPETIRRPPHWGGLTLQAGYYEFWQGRPSRLHDRLAYTFVNKNWRMERLAP